MSAQANYFKLGMFILSGAALLLAGLIALGLGSATKDKLMMETYFKESVQGIEVGSPVKFLGVKVGAIERVTFSFDKYRDFSTTPLRYVMVEFGLDPGKTFDFTQGENLHPLLEKEIQRGLRIKVAPQGITGTAYLEMTYVDPKTNPPLPIEWTPQYDYIPSVPGTITRLQEALTKFSDTMDKIRQAGIEKTVNKVNALLDETRKTVADANVAEISAKVSRLISGLQQTNNNLDEIVESEEFQSAVANFSATMKNMKNATKTLPQALNDLRILLINVSDAVASQRGEVRSILRNTDKTMENLSRITGDAKKNPARLFWGEPPVHKEP